MKYLLYNDIFYVIHKKKGLLAVLLVAPLLVILLNASWEVSTFKILTDSTGTNLQGDSVGFLNVLMYLFNVSGFLYFIVDIYGKDLCENLENIFLRMKSAQYIIQKSIYFLVTMILIKVIQYGFFTLCLLITGNHGIDFRIVQLLFTDMSYTLLFQYSALLVYLIYILLRKRISFLVIPVLIFLWVFPKSIWELHRSVWALILIMIGVQILICFLFSKKSKLLIERI